MAWEAAWLWTCFLHCLRILLLRTHRQGSRLGAMIEHSISRAVLQLIRASH